MMMNQAQDIDLQNLDRISMCDMLTGDTEILLRNIQYPYRALLAIGSGLNETH